jgi:hypothetical protein
MGKDSFLSPNHQYRFFGNYRGPRPRQIPESPKIYNPHSAFICYTCLEIHYSSI